MTDLARVDQAALSSALTGTAGRLQRRLPPEELEALGIMLEAAARRYPNQDLAGAMGEYMADLEKLALKFSLRKVLEAIEHLRIAPGQDFFPSPAQVAQEIVDAQDRSYWDRLAEETELRLRRERDERQRLLNDPEEIAWRVAHYGYDVYRFDNVWEAALACQAKQTEPPSEGALQ